MRRRQDENNVSAQSNSKQSKITFYRGIPRGLDRSTFECRWITRCNNRFGIPTNTFQLHMMFSYDELKQIYPWAKNFRAGTILVHRRGDKYRDFSEVLLVYQQPVLYTDNGEHRIIPSHWGFTKGSWNPGDRSAFQTAVRETEEEIGINILDLNSNAKITHVAFAVPRPEHGIEEVFIYFLVLFDYLPVVRINDKEIKDYQWAPLSRNLSHMLSFTKPTQVALHMLHNVDIWDPSFVPLMVLPIMG